MMTTLKVLLATALFGGIHSALASRPVKRSVGEAIGTERFNAFYRLFFNAQSVLTFGMLVAVISTQRRRTIYRVRGVRAAALCAGQLAGILHAVVAAREVGIGRLTGISDVAASISWSRGPAGRSGSGSGAA